METMLESVRGNVIAPEPTSDAGDNTQVRLEWLTHFRQRVPFVAVKNRTD